jgi:hypothetical protein
MDTNSNLDGVLRLLKSMQNQNPQSKETSPIQYNQPLYNYYIYDYLGILENFKISGEGGT